VESDGARRRVVVVQFLRSYRQGLFDRLAEALPAEGFDLLVASDEPDSRLAAREDAIEAPWAVRVPSRRLSVRGRDLVSRSLSAASIGPDDLVIVEQALKNAETYRLLMRRNGPRVAMWGHGRSYSTPQGEHLASVKQWLTRRADWFFAYTDAGARHVIERGYPADRVTILRNTIDTEALRGELDAVTDVAGFEARLGLTPGRTALFVGGVDADKGIDFLLESARIAAGLLPGFVLLVGGAGAELAKVRAAEQAGAPVRTLGRLEGPDKATALVAASVIAVPEWIGLVAVDALVGGRPVISTVHPSHSPEHEYLEDGVTALFSEHDPEAYARALIGVLDDPARLARMQEACLAASEAHSVDAMVDAFVDGIRSWAASPR
jgi:glycosyltransferase involved in cell wall biosynthesis